MIDFVNPECEEIRVSYDAKVYLDKYLVSSDLDIFKAGGFVTPNIVFIPEHVFGVVHSFVTKTTVRKIIEGMMTKDDDLGIPYWVFEYGYVIASMILAKHKDFDREDVYNSLKALGLIIEEDEIDEGNDKEQFGEVVMGE